MTKKEARMTKEEAVREEVRFGRDHGMFATLTTAVPGLSVDRLTAIADGAPLEQREVDFLFSLLLNDDEVALEDEPDPEAPSERDRVRSWVIRYVDGVEGPCLCLTQTKHDGGMRFAGPKPWGGGQIVRSWAVDPANIFEALGFKGDEAAELAARVEAIRQNYEDRGFIHKP